MKTPRVGDSVPAEIPLAAVDQNVEINEEHRPGIAHANLMAVLHTGDGLDGLGDALLEAFRGAIEKRVDGAAAQLDADPNDDDGHPEGGDSVALAQKAERREDLAGFDGDQAEDHHRRAPDIGAEVQGIGFEGLAVVFFGRASEDARAGEIDRNRSDHHSERPEGHFNFDTVVKQASHRFPDDPGTGDDEKGGFEEGGKILDFTVAVEVAVVGRLGGNADGEESHHGRNQIERRMGGLGQNAETSSKHADQELETREADSGDQRAQRGRLFLALLRDRNRTAPPKLRLTWQTPAVEPPAFVCSRRQELRFFLNDIVAEHVPDFGYGAGLVVVIASRTEDGAGGIRARMHKAEINAAEEAAVLERGRYGDGSAVATGTVQEIDNRGISLRAGGCQVFPTDRE